MSGTSLRDFVSRTVEHKRIRFGDLRRLKRDILPARITTREQAEVLIALDSSIDKADREWRRYLITTVGDFPIWGSPPAGRMDGDKAEWLAAALQAGSSRKTARAITREIVREAPELDGAALQVLSMNLRGRRVRGDLAPPSLSSYEPLARDEPLPADAPLSPSIWVAPPQPQRG